MLGLPLHQPANEMLVLLLTALLQGAAAILALVLTANVVFAQLQPYQLPAQYLTLWDRQTTWMYGLLGASTLWPAVIVMLDAYSLTWTAVALFAVTIALLGLYIRFRPRSVVLDRFFDEMVTHPALRREAATDIHQMCLSAMERSDFETFRRSCLVLFSIDEGSDRVYRLWNDLLSRTPDEPAAFTPVSEALYVCGSPLAEAQDIAAPSTMATRPRGSMPANPLYSSVLSEHAPTYFARLQLMTESLDWGRRRLVRQEVVENMLLLLLDLLTLPDDHPLVKESRVEPSVAALLAHLEEAEEAALLPAFGGDGVYHHQLFTLPYDGRLNPRQREDLAERRRCAWNRVVGHLYHERHWRDQSHLRVAVWRDGDGSPQVLTDGDAVEAIAGGPGDDGLRCEHSLMGGGARL